MRRCEYETNKITTVKLFCCGNPMSEIQGKGLSLFEQCVTLSVFSGTPVRRLPQAP